ILTVLLITTVFYNHPSTTNVTLFFRTVPILPETNGRVAEIFVGYSGPVKKGDPIFRLYSSQQEAAVETPRRKIDQVNAHLVMAQLDIAKADAQIQEAKASLQQAQDELDTKLELQRRNPGIVAARDIEKLQVSVDGRKGTVDAATAARDGAQSRLTTLL